VVHGWCKLNADGAAKGNPEKARVGGLIRDEHDKWLGVRKSILEVDSKVVSPSIDRTSLVAMGRFLEIFVLRVIKIGQLHRNMYIAMGTRVNDDTWQVIICLLISHHVI
ncbi:hypothetical protein CRG98_016720, partial [Punica granatum]